VFKNIIKKNKTKNFINKQKKQKNKNENKIIESDLESKFSFGDNN
jgi:hypothetical protein